MTILANRYPVALDGNFNLECPLCGYLNLHQDTVEVFNREEDAKTGLHATVDGSKVSLDTAMGGNPSSRRHGLSIGFWCEGCDELGALRLNVVQHKGCTEIYWSTA